jgi:hypothetical protein
MRKGLLLAVCLFAVSDPARAATPVSPAAVAATPAPKPARPLTQREKKLAESAPADVYFGRLGMSPISIRTTVGFLGRQYHWRTISDRDLLRKALLTEDALRSWRSKYPQDPWLAPTFFHLEQLYQAVQTEESRKHATVILTDVIRYYPDTKQGHLSRARLAAGFPRLVPETPLIATPASPSASSQPTPAAADSAGGSPAPSAESSASPAASASGSPTPAPSTSPR